MQSLKPLSLDFLLKTQWAGSLGHEFFLCQYVAPPQPFLGYPCHFPSPWLASWSKQQVRSILAHQFQLIRTRSPLATGVPKDTCYLRATKSSLEVEARGSDSEEGALRTRVEKVEFTSAEIPKFSGKVRRLALWLFPTLPTSHLLPSIYMGPFIKRPGNVCQQPGPIFPDSSEGQPCSAAKLSSNRPRSKSKQEKEHMGQGCDREENLPIQSRSYAGSHTKGEQLDHLEAPDVRWRAEMTGGRRGLGWQGERGLGVRPSCFTLCEKIGSGHLPFPQSYMILLWLNSQLWLLVVFFSFLRPSSRLPFTPYSTCPFISKERPQSSPSFGLDQTFALIWHFFTEPIHPPLHPWHHLFLLTSLQGIPLKQNQTLVAEELAKGRQWKKAVGLGSEAAGFSGWSCPSSEKLVTIKRTDQPQSEVQSWGK